MMRVSSQCKKSFAPLRLQIIGSETDANLKLNSFGQRMCEWPEFNSVSSDSIKLLLEVVSKILRRGYLQAKRKRL